MEDASEHIASLITSNAAMEYKSPGISRGIREVEYMNVSHKVALIDLLQCQCR